jgi:hypothetical protein
MPASWLSSRLRRLSDESRYSGSERTSSATNMVSRSLRGDEHHHAGGGEHGERVDLGLAYALQREHPLDFAAWHRRPGRGERVTGRVQGSLGVDEHAEQREDRDGRLGEHRAGPSMASAPLNVVVGALPTAAIAHASEAVSATTAIETSR